MKAVIQKSYGEPGNVLEIAEVPKPAPTKNQVLIKVMATTINDFDWSAVTGRPYAYRPLFGFFKPRKPIAGMEVAGIVEATGTDVQQFKPGDAVYGDISQYGFGAFAEYLCINEKAVVKKPENLSFEDAVALPHASLLALQAMRDIGKITNGQKVLINGAGGGFGTIATQLAKLHDCEITGVDADDKLDLLKSNGVDHVIDYRKEDFTKNGKQYDLVLDCKSNRPAFAYLRSLKPNGKYITVGGTPGILVNLLLVGKMATLSSGKKVQILALKPNAGLDYIEQLVRENKLKNVIDGPYTMEEIPRLIQYFGEGKHKGKIVVKIG